MKKNLATFTILMFLFLPAIIFAQANETITTTSTTSSTGTPLPSFPYGITSLKDIYNFSSSINPFVLLILGIILFVVAHLSKYVAIILIIFAVIQIIFLLIR
ncbi:MAG TPA: hypothetical protein VJJ76_03665 [archaeon]|nr:hypothetical protein [archaeon]